MIIIYIILTSYVFGVFLCRLVDLAYSQSHFGSYKGHLMRGYWLIPIWNIIYAIYLMSLHLNAVLSIKSFKYTDWFFHPIRYKNRAERDQIKLIEELFKS